MNYRIGDVAKIVDLSIHTLRFYEKEGLLGKIQRDENGRRFYSDKDVELIEVIECLKKTGMSLEEIKKYIYLFRDQDDYSARIDLFQKQRKVLLDQISALQQQLAMADYKIWYYQNINIEVDEKDPLHRKKMRSIYDKKYLNNVSSSVK